MKHPSLVFLNVDAEDQPRILRQYPDAVCHSGRLTGDEIVQICRDANVISHFSVTAFPREVIEQLPQLRLLCTRSVGTDHIDLSACQERGITVCNVPDYGSHVIAEHVFALLLSSIRHIHEGHRRVQEGIFDYHGLRGIALKGKTIGIVGTGRIGRAVARIAHGFDMHIVAQDVCRTEELVEQYGVRYVERDELFAVSDILSLHAPSLPSTKHMVNADSIASMKDGVILVNTARGSLIDSSALLAALQSGKVARALLDVLEHEADVAADKQLVQHPNVVTTPHIAFFADDTMRAMYDETIRSIDAWIAGNQPTNIVQPLHVECQVPPA